MQKRSVSRWKRITAVAVTASLMLCSVSNIGFSKVRNNDFVTLLDVEAYSTGNYKVKTSGSNLNVRSGPGTGYSSIGKLSNGSSFTVYEISGGWGKISSSSSQWVCLQYSTYVGSSNSGSSSSTSSSGKTGTGVVNCSALNVRTGPSTSYGVKTTLKSGASVNITSTSGNWGYDSLHSGYVSLRYIKFTSGGSSNYSSVDTSRSYQFEVKCAGNKVIDVAGWGTGNNTNIQIWERGKTQANQTFQPISVGSGYYVLKDLNSGKVIDVAGGVVKDGANVILYDYHGGANQQWRFIYKGKENGHNWYELESKINGNYCLDVSGANSANGTNIQLWSRNGSNAQKFMMWYGQTSSSSSSGSSSNSNWIDIVKEILNINSNKGHSEFKPMQQHGQTYSGYKWCKKCNTSISNSGCGIMATINAVGYLTGNKIDPISAASKCSDLHLCGSGGKYDIPARIVSNFSSSYGVTITENWSNFKSKQKRTVDTTIGRRTYYDFPTASAFETEWSKLITHLKKGDVAVTLVPHHYIAIVAYDEKTGKVLVYDSATSKARGTSTDGTWVSKDQLNINSSVSSPGTYKTELKLRYGFIYIGRK